MNDYLYDVDEAQYSFVRVPKLLLQHEAYQRISSEAEAAVQSSSGPGRAFIIKTGLEGQTESHLYHLSDRRGHGGNELRKEQSRTAFG